MPEGTTTNSKDSGVNVQPINKGLPSTVSDEGTVKTTPLPEGLHMDKDSEIFKPPADMEPLTTPVADPTRIDAKYQADQTQSARLRYRSLTKNKEESEDEIFEAGDEMDEEVQPTNEEETHSPSPNKEQPESSRAQDTESDSDSSCPKVLKKYDNWEKHKEAVASYVDLKSKIKRFHDAAYKVQPVSLSYSHSSKALIFRD
ncbi:hypothetical protein Tco_1188529 [Tanacetum coccineum]